MLSHRLTGTTDAPALTGTDPPTMTLAPPPAQGRAAAPSSPPTVRPQGAQMLSRQDLRDNDAAGDAALIDALNQPAGLDELAAAATMDAVDVVEDTDNQDQEEVDHDDH